MHLLPRSLFARLALTLFTVLLLAQLVALGIQLSDRAQVFYRAIGVPLAQQLATTVNRLEGLPPERRGAGLPRFTGPRLRLALQPRPSLAEEDSARLVRSVTGLDLWHYYLFDMGLVYI